MKIDRCFRIEEVTSMKVVNPLNRVPETEETIIMGGCHCTCYSGHQSTYNVAWLPIR